MTQRPTPTATARVVLPNPSADNDTDEDVGEDAEAEEIDDGDFLADFPDNTEVRCCFGCIYFLCLRFPPLLVVRFRN